jgi:FkbM family methyltransferase
MLIRKIKRLVKDILTNFFDKNFYNEHLSFAQAGEDKVIEFFFMTLGISIITYLEIGTNDPVHYNNTYLFYLKGSRGVCVEPNPALIANIRKFRPEDVCLNVGIAKERDEALDFYIFDDFDEAKGLSTFSKEVATHVESTTPIKVSCIKKIPVINVREVLDNYFATKAPDLISIDVEGLDLDVLQSFDFDSCRPTAICVETVNFTMNYKKIKRTDIIDFMLSNNYFVYADTGINSIFVDKNIF